MTILCVWQECSRNVLWIVFSCTPFPRPLVRASSNNSSTVEFGARGGSIAPSAIPPSSRGSLGSRWSGSGPPDCHPSSSRHPTRVRVLPSFSPCPLLYEHNLLAEEADSLVKKNFFFFFYVEEIFIDSFSPPCAWGGDTGRQQKVVPDSYRLKPPLLWSV